MRLPAFEFVMVVLRARHHADEEGDGALSALGDFECAGDLIEVIGAIQQEVGDIEGIEQGLGEADHGAAVFAGEEIGVAAEEADEEDHGETGVLGDSSEVIDAGVEAGVLDLDEWAAAANDEAGGEGDGFVLGGGLDEARFVDAVE
jgi:hypothetical protein